MSIKYNYSRLQVYEVHGAIPCPMPTEAHAHARLYLILLKTAVSLFCHFGREYSGMVRRSLMVVNNQNSGGDAPYFN
ncbi:hypothetical protein QUA81_22330 [Microcoleus sp. F6_B4]